MSKLDGLLMNREQWSSMTHAERVRHYSAIVSKLKIVTAANLAVYAMFVVGIAYLLAGDSLELIRGERDHDPMILAAMAVAWALSVWKLLGSWKAYRAQDGLHAELTKGLIPESLRPAGVPPDG